MDQALSIHEILLNIFGSCSFQYPKMCCLSGADLVALARTCQTFKEPALDVLWEELSNLSPLARCLPEACCKPDRWSYSFSRLLSEAEWNTLRSYTRRIWHVHNFSGGMGSLDPSAIRVVFALAPFTGPLFPNLRSLSWRDLMIPAVQVAIPSLTSLRLSFISWPAGIPLPIEFLDVVGERCPNIKNFEVFSLSDPLYTAIRRQICRWQNLQYLDCENFSLSRDVIWNLPSISTLRSISFRLSTDSDNHALHFDSVSVFPNLTCLGIKSRFLQSITRLFSRIQLPVVEELIVIFSKKVSKQNVKVFWDTIQKACPSNTLTYLTFYGRAIKNSSHLDEWTLTLGDLPLNKTFGNLHKIHINLLWSVRLTDTGLLDLVSTSPDLEELLINDHWGWRADDNDGGITLSGLVQLLRQCPPLRTISLAIDTQTFTHIPHGLDMSFPPRSMFLDFLDSYISPELVPGLASVLIALKLEHSNLALARTTGKRDPESAEEARLLWERVHEELRKVYLTAYFAGHGIDISPLFLH